MKGSTMTTITEHVAGLRSAAPHPTKPNRYLVTPNTAPAYRYSGAWGIYDTERYEWVNFRETELAAYQLLATLLQDTKGMTA
jgi:hypothetical protein